MRALAHAVQRHAAAEAEVGEAGLLAAAPRARSTSMSSSTRCTLAAMSA